jgi:hypothetical protein
MNPHHLPWHAIVLLALKLFKMFGIIPGSIAAFSMRKFYQKWRQNRAIAGWPSTEANILWAKVHNEGPKRYWVELTYTYFVGEYRSGTHVHRFRREADADEFVREIKDKRVQVRYNDSSPDQSVILDRDLEMLALMAPQLS